MALLTMFKAQLATIQAELTQLQNQPAIVQNCPVNPQINQPTINNQPTMPDQPIVPQQSLGIETPVPSCILQVTQSTDNSRNGNFSWTYQNIADNTPAQLFVGNTVGIGQGETEFQWFTLGVSVPASDKHYNNLPVDFQLPMHNKFKLTIGDASCTADYTPPTN